MKFIGDMIKALFGLSILTFLYVLFLYKEPKEALNTTKNIESVSMEEAIKILNNKDNPTPTQTSKKITKKIVIKKENIKTIDISHPRAIKAINVLHDYYGIFAVPLKERYLGEKSYEFDIQNKDIEKRITVNFLHKIAEVYTNPNASTEEYFIICSAVFSSLIGIYNKEYTEGTMLSIFKDAKEKGQIRSSYKIRDVQIDIKVDSLGLLGCQFMKD